MPMLNLDEPMLIEGSPHLVVRVIGKHPGGQLEGIVYNLGMTTHITFRENGWISSTTYATDRVINLSVHETSEQVVTARGIEEMQRNPAWGSF